MNKNVRKQSIPLPDSVIPTRHNRCLLYRKDEYLCFTQENEQKDTPQKACLNATAALIWQLCDGSLNIKELISVLHEQFPDADKLNDEVDLLLKILIQGELMFFANAEHRSNPVFRLCFDLTDDAGININQLQSMLLGRFSIILDTPDSADILITDKAVKQSDAGSDQVVITIGAPKGLADITLLSEEYVAESDLPETTFYLQELLAKASTQTAFFACFMEPAPIPVTKHKAATISSPKPKLTIGMATYDDYDGTYFSIQAIRMYHPEVTEETEILIIDNNPKGVCAEALKSLARSAKGCRYVANDKINGTWAKYFIFNESTTEYVLCIDSHVFIEPGRIRQLIDYFDEQSQPGDLLQGPLIYDDLKNYSTHFNPIWNSGMFGAWGTDERGARPENEAFEIPMQGMGLFACRRADWPGFNPRFSGFGGEEGYVHQKFRNNGGRALCLPFLRWMHRFARPMGARYQNIWEARIRNYLIGFEEVGFDLAPVEEHFSNLVSQKAVDRVKRILELEIDNPFDAFDMIYCINLDTQTERWQRMEKRFDTLGITFRVKRFSAIERNERHQIGRVLSHRAVVQDAQDQGYGNILVIEDDALFHEDALQHLESAMTELKHQQWHVFYLGGTQEDEPKQTLQNCQFLGRPTRQISAQVVAYHAGFYERLLKEIPAGEEMEPWAETYGSIDQYLRTQEKRIVMSPIIATQSTSKNDVPESVVDPCL